jgi:phenylpropionate dioxygenase-like ring-hydroxylating dioxygenase large terminal subunit
MGRVGESQATLDWEARPISEVGPRKPRRAAVLRCTEQPALRRFWYPVAQESALADGPLARRLMGESIVVWQPNPGSVAAAIDRCPHRDARLSGGWIDDGCLVCPYHGWVYGDDGAAVRIPQLSANVPIPPTARLASVRAALRYGWVWAALDEPVAPIPDVADWGAPGQRVIHEPDSLWSCSAAHLVDNNLDPAHVAFVHRGSFGNPDRPEVPVPEVTRTKRGMEWGYELAVDSQPGVDAPTVRRTTNTLFAPFLLVLQIDYPGGVRHTMLKACTPVDDANTRQLQVVLRSDAEVDRPAADILAFDAHVWEEDKAVLEAIEVPFALELSRNVHVRVDRTSIEYRRLLADLIA